MLQQHCSGFFTVTEFGDLFFIVEWAEDLRKWKVSASHPTGFPEHEAALAVLRQYCQPWGGCWKYAASGEVAA